MNSGYETREAKKANKLRLNSIGTRVTSSIYNPKSIMNKIRKAGLKGNTLQVSVAQNELSQLEKDGAKDNMIANQLQNKTSDGKEKYTEKNRLF